MQFWLKKLKIVQILYIFAMYREMKFMRGSTAYDKNENVPTCSHWREITIINYHKLLHVVMASHTIFERYSFAGSLGSQIFVTMKVATFSDSGWKVGHWRNRPCTTLQLCRFLCFCSLNNVKLFQLGPNCRFREQQILLPERKQNKSELFLLYCWW